MRRQKNIGNVPTLCMRAAGLRRSNQKMNEAQVSAAGAQKHDLSGKARALRRGCLIFNVTTGVNSETICRIAAKERKSRSASPGL
jgi:hypothetical protein